MIKKIPTFFRLYLIVIATLGLIILLQSHNQHFAKFKKIQSAIEEATDMAESSKSAAEESVELLKMLLQR